MSRIAALLVTAVLTANAQCVADCGVLPCEEQSTRPAAPEPCHHQTAPADPQPSPNCAHPQFVSDSLQAVALHVDLVTVAWVAVHLDQVPLESPLVSDLASDRPPPLLSASASHTVLRV